MSPDAKLRMEVYQEGQRAMNRGAACPYTDWRAGTWAKGLAAAKAHRANTLAETEPPADPRWGALVTNEEKIEHLLQRIEQLEAKR